MPMSDVLSAIPPSARRLAEESHQAQQSQLMEA